MFLYSEKTAILRFRLKSMQVRRIGAEKRYNAVMGVNRYLLLVIINCQHVFFIHTELIGYVTQELYTSSFFLKFSNIPFIFFRINK